MAQFFIDFSQRKIDCVLRGGDAVVGDGRMRDIARAQARHVAGGAFIGGCVFSAVKERLMARETRLPDLAGAADSTAMRIMAGPAPQAAAAGAGAAALGKLLA